MRAGDNRNHREKARVRRFLLIEGCRLVRRVARQSMGAQ